MTTYLATLRPGGESEKTFAFCLKPCRAWYFNANEKKFTTRRDDDSYEFDEVCQNCGSLIKASK